MEEKEKAPRRAFTPEQKFEIVRDVERHATIKEGLQKYQIADSLYRKWKRQLMVGVRASMRNTRAVKSPNLKKLEEENRKLKEVVLNQSLTITSLKKEMSLD